MIPRGFVDVTSDLPERRARASFLEVTNPAVCGSRQVIPDPTIMNCSGGSQRPAVRTDIDVARAVVSEVEVGEHPVGSLVSIPHWNMRRDVHVEEPSQQLASSISGIGCYLRSLYAERHLCSFDHGRGCSRLVMGA